MNLVIGKHNPGYFGKKISFTQHRVTHKVEVIIFLTVNL